MSHLSDLIPDLSGIYVVEREQTGTSYHQIYAFIKNLGRGLGAGATDRDTYTMIYDLSSIPWK